MLSPDDAELARRDRDLEGLTILLDPEVMTAELSARGIDGLEDLLPSYVRYKPGASCLVGYRSSRRDGEIALHATTYAGALEDKSAKARARANRAAACGSRGLAGSSLYVDRARASVSFFPCDADLPAMARLQEPVLRAKLLARVFRHAEEVPRTEVEQLAYKPGRRFVGRVAWADGRAAVLRLYASAARARAMRLPHRLVDGENLRVARRVGGSKRHQAVAVEWIPGASLRENVRSNRSSAQPSFARVARALAEFHQTPIDERDRLVPRLPVLGLREIERELAWLVPSRTESLSVLRECIESRLASIPLSRRLVHGDFYDKQVVVSEGGVGLIDLDEMSVGDPRQDVGLLLAHWERDRCLAELTDLERRLDAEFCGHYQESTEDRLTDLPVFVAAALFRLAQHPFRMRLPDWQRQIGVLLERVEELLAS